ncbi:class I SAM-dependent methyltransferase [bacterium]|nr:class I SAM-dependent methyltransferase [bacterium]MBU1676929.1 class I SAM-dependent methyltransferase [bacterium]
MSKLDPKTSVELTAATADKHRLYEDAVQNPAAEVEFIDRVYRGEFDRLPRDLREDFCGTLNLGCAWVRERADNTVLGVDLDGPTLDWGRAHNVAPLGAAAARVTMVQDDVRNVSAPSADVIAATNFSWWGLHTREELLAYLRNCRRSLRAAGMLMLDIYGGPEAQVLQLEERECEGYTYVWDQDLFNPITHEYRCRIHFQFPDGSELNDAFAYHWRLWTVPEVRDLLSDAGFRKVEVFWEGADDQGEPDGDFQVSVEGDTSPAWIAYIVAFR